MSKETLTIRRKDIVLGTILAVSLSVVVSESLTSGKNPSKDIDYPESLFTPLIIHHEDDKNEANSNIKIFSPLPEISHSPDEQRILDLQNETEQYVQIAQESGKFSNRWIDSLKMYGPIYIATAKKSGIDWKMLWITHEEESGASAKESKAFDGSNYPYVGGMQRNKNTWSDEFVKEAFSGLEYLKVIPTNHEDDAGEIAGAAAMMGPNMEKYRELGIREAVFNTFALFTGSEDLAQERLDIWIMTDNVFSLPDNINRFRSK